MTRARGYPARGESLDMASSTLTGKIFCGGPRLRKLAGIRPTKNPALRAFRNRAPFGHTSEDDETVHDQRDAAPERKVNRSYASRAWRGSPIPWQRQARGICATIASLRVYWVNAAQPQK